MKLVESYGHDDNIISIGWSQLFNDSHLGCRLFSGGCIFKLNTMCTQRHRPLPARQQRYIVSCLLKSGGIDATNNTCPIDQNIHRFFSPSFVMRGYIATEHNKSVYDRY